MADLYISSVAYTAVQTWNALTGGVATTVSVGTIVRQTYITKPIYLIWSAYSSSSATDTATINFGASAFAMAAPSGFSGWDTSGTTTFDPSNKGSNITLSNGNLTASKSVNGWQSVRSTTSKTTGKWYFEISVTALSTNGQVYGAGDSAASMSNYAGSSTDSFGWQATNGTGYEIGGWQSVNTNSTTVGIAIDVDKGICWIRDSASTNWNNNPSADPATGTGAVGINPQITNLGNERCFRVSTAGTTNTTEPTWVLTYNGTTSDGTVTWTECSGQAAYQQQGGITNTWTAPAARINNLTSTGNSAMAAGDRVFLSSDHAEIQYSNLTLAFPGSSASPNVVMSVNRTTGNIPPAATDYTTGASITTNSSSLAVNGTNRLYGITFQIGYSGSSSLNILNTSNNGNCYYRDCKFVNIGGSILGSEFVSGTYSVWDNTTIKCATTGDSVHSNAGFLIWKNTPSAIDASGSIPTTLFVGAGGGNAGLEVSGVDLSAVTVHIISSTFTWKWGAVIFRNCKINSSINLFSTGNDVDSFPGQDSAYGRFISFINHSSTNDTYHNYWATNSGYTITDSSTTRVSGASDGTTPYSVKLVSASAGMVTPHWHDIFIWNTITGFSKTATIEIISSTTLYNDDIWGDLEYLGNTGSGISSYADDFNDNPLTTHIAQTTSTATWNNPPGTPVTQKLQITFTAQKAGLLQFRVKLAKASTIVWVDPLITIT